MATNANPLASLGQPQPGGLPEQSLPQPLPQEEPRPIDPAEGLPYEILARSYKLKIDGSRRMVTRDRLRELMQWLTQYLFNGQIMDGLMSQGQTIDVKEVLMAAKDATGVDWPYNFVRQMTPEEQKARQTPPPQVAAQMQMKQQDAQTRMQIMQMKTSNDQQIAQLQAQMKEMEISEESAWRILDILQKDKAAAASRPDPEAELALKKQELDLKRQEGEQRLKHDDQKHQLDIIAQMAKHQMGMRQGAEQTAMQMQQSAVTGAQASQQSDDKHQMNLRQMEEKAAMMKALGGTARGKGEKKDPRVG